jgi:hypothetical protein
LTVRFYHFRPVHFRQANHRKAAKHMLSPTQLEALLYHLCVEYGFCLHPDKRRRLCADPPSGVTAFTNAVYRAEGLDPATADQRVYRLVLGAVAEAFRRGGPPG